MSSDQCPVHVQVGIDAMYVLHSSCQMAPYHGYEYAMIKASAAAAGEATALQGFGHHRSVYQAIKH